MTSTGVPRSSTASLAALRWASRTGTAPSVGSIRSVVLPGFVLEVAIVSAGVSSPTPVTIPPMTGGDLRAPAVVLWSPHVQSPRAAGPSSRAGRGRKRLPVTA